jgi:hypothetical protein
MAPKQPHGPPMTLGNMRSIAALCFVAFAVSTALPLSILPAKAQSPNKTASSAEPFEGLWAQTKEECLDEEGPNSRTLIDLRNVVGGKATPIFDQYENHCLIDRRSVLGSNSTLEVTCFEFWEDFRKGTGGHKTIVKLSPGRHGSLGIDGQSYQRCLTGKQ